MRRISFLRLSFLLLLVQLLSGCQQGRMAMAQLKEADFPNATCHFSYADAGHFSIIPNTPVILTAPETGAGETYVNFGGTQNGSAAAARDAWAQVLAFLETGTCTNN